MYTSRTLLSVFIAALFALSVPVQARDDEDIGTPVTEAELSAFFAILPDGEGLPPGSGNAVQGLAIYAEKCAMCHGEKLEGIYDTGAPPLAGGAKSLATKQPLKTIESYWPYATTLYDYIWRSMPFHEPGSLTADEVYALSAYILSVGKVIGEGEVMNAQSLPKVKMPNANGFYVDPGPDRLIYRPAKAPPAKK